MDKLKYPTTMRKINGTWYLRVPPAFADYLEIIENTEMDMLADTNKDGKKYIAFWVQGQ
jgi:hypothetical protein